MGNLGQAEVIASRADSRLPFEDEWEWAVCGPEHRIFPRNGEFHSIARSLASDSPLLVADEPTGNLDSKTTESIQQVFGELVRNVKAVIVVTLGKGAKLRFSFSYQGLLITLITTILFGYLVSRIPVRKAITVFTGEALAYE